MPLILGAQSAATGGFVVENSCRFNDANSPTLTKTQSAGNRDKWTFSCWFKLGTKNTLIHYILGVKYDATNATIIQIDAADYLRFNNQVGGSNDSYKQSNQKFFDTSAWYHLFCVYDSGNADSSLRQLVYLNGTQITSWQSDVTTTLNEDSFVNDSATSMIIGNLSGESNWWDGYLAEVVLLDGTAAAVTDFGEFDEDSPSQWKPKDPSGLAFGTNGFYLDFKDSANLGNDANGGTDFTESGIDAADQSTDTPSNNFAVLNPTEYMGGSAPTFSEGNCQYVQGGSSQYYPASGSVGLTAGKWYWEVQSTNGANNASLFGIAGDAAYGANMTSYSNQILGYTAQQWGYYGNNGNYRTNNGNVSYGTGFYGNVIIGVYLDLDNNKLYFGNAGTIQASGTGISITAAADTDAGFYVPAGNYWGGSDTFQYNFGGTPAFAISSAQQDVNGYGNFEYSPNDGGSASFDGSAKDFLAICTKNLGSDGG